MTVYVDDMYLYPMGEFGRMKMSHMIADDRRELIRFAARIGIAKKWFQYDHFDVSISKRKLAIECGALPITLRQLAAMSAYRRMTDENKLRNPKIAERLFAELMDEDIPF